MQRTKAEMLNIVWQMRQTEKITKAITGVEYSDMEMIQLQNLPLDVINYCE